MKQHGQKAATLLEIETAAEGDYLAMFDGDVTDDLRPWCGYSDAEIDVIIDRLYVRGLTIVFDYSGMRVVSIEYANAKEGQGGPR